MTRVLRRTRLWRAYQAAREGGWSSAASALRYVRTHVLGPKRRNYADVLTWDDETATGRAHGFDIRVRVRVDEDPDTSYLGAWSDTWAPGAVDRKAAGTWDRNQFRYFIPSDMRGVEHKYQRADWRRMEGLASGDWNYVMVRVTVSRHGIELGSASCGGIESDAGDYIRREVADDLIYEALGAARSAVASLCGGVA